MYLYFDVNGNLKEIINYPVREGDDNVNKIYVYMEPSSNKSQRINKADYSDYNFENEPIEDYVDVLVLPSIYNSWDALFKISDSDVILNNGILLGDDIDDSYIIKQIPYDKERDLKYFSYSKYYKFIEITLTSSITQYNGRCDCTVSMLNDDPARIKKLDVFSFFIQESVVLKDVNITYAQYEYLYNLCSGNIELNYVPYTGATSNVDLDEQGLSSGFVSADEIYGEEFYIENDEDNNTVRIAQASSGDEQLTESRTLFLPNSNGVIATKEWVASNYIPYSGATSDVNLGNHSLSLSTLSFYAYSGGTAISCGGFGVSSAGNLYVESSGDGGVYFDVADGVYIGTSKGTNNVNEVATKGSLPSKAICGQFSTGLFTQTAGGNYAAEDIPLHGFIDGSDIIVITWDNCFAICPIPAVPEADGRVVAAMWNASGEAQTIRIRYSVTDNNSLCNISLQGGFTPPSNHTAYIICYKLIAQ